MPWKPTIKKNRSLPKRLTFNTKTERLAEGIHVAGYKDDNLLLTRGLCYGSAAACFVVIITLAQVGLLSSSLRIALYAASLALPLWIFTGAMYELFIYLGRPGYVLYRKPISQRLLLTSFCLASIGLIVATTGALAHLAIGAAWVFGMMTALAVIVYIVFFTAGSAWLVLYGPSVD
jgi:hypothetical protein